MKAAGHELKGMSSLRIVVYSSTLPCRQGRVPCEYVEDSWLGMTAVYNCHIDEITLPLMALIDYRGFRVVAMTLLPVKGADTLIYGSDNGGNRWLPKVSDNWYSGLTVLAKDPKFNELMEEVGKYLNLKAHLAGKRNSVVIHLPADIEGHHSLIDGGYYMLGAFLFSLFHLTQDFARLMPPQVALKKDRGRRHLFELLRPELVISNKVPLSSGELLSLFSAVWFTDALTGMGRWDPEHGSHNVRLLVWHSPLPLEWCESCVLSAFLGRNSGIHPWVWALCHFENWYFSNMSQSLKSRHVHTCWDPIGSERDVVGWRSTEAAKVD